jgi:hypothetical protein
MTLVELSEQVGVVVVNHAVWPDPGRAENRRRPGRAR